MSDIAHVSRVIMNKLMHYIQKTVRHRPDCIKCDAEMIVYKIWDTKHFTKIRNSGFYCRNIT